MPKSIYQRTMDSIIKRMENGEQSVFIKQMRFLLLGETPEPIRLCDCRNYADCLHDAAKRNSDSLSCAVCQHYEKESPI